MAGRQDVPKTAASVIPPQVKEADPSEDPDGYLSSFLVTIVDDDEAICEILTKWITSWGLKCYALPPPYALDALLERCAGTHIYILDYLLPDCNTLDWIPHIKASCPDSRIIVMTGFADMTTVIKAVRLGAADFLVKPVKPDLLKHSVTRTARMIASELRTRELLQELQKNNELLGSQKKELEFLNARLIETNKAFSTLAQNLDFDRMEIQKQLSGRIKAEVIPIVRKLQADSNTAKYTYELAMLLKTLEHIAAGIMQSDNPSSELTTAELRVASLIRSGLTSEQIAEKLFISVDTVKTHRKRIRKKLKLTGSSDPLRDFLTGYSELNA